MRTFFSGGDINRLSWLRADAGELEKKIASARSRFVITWQGRCLLESDAPALVQRSEIEHVVNIDAAVYLGIRNDIDLFVINLPDDLAESQSILRPGAGYHALLSELPAADAALLAYAKGMIEWRNRHQFCGVCGHANHAIYGGSILQCSSTACAKRSFPRIDPAIIVLTTRADTCLLGRQTSWPEGRFSTIAGFVEPGEALEDAVRREVHEETNIKVGECHYLGSQPWPFPSSLMIGFHAQGESADIALNDGELAEARWFSREDLATGAARLPPPTSIAFQLIERWFDPWDGPALSSLDICSSFSNSKDAEE
jgi:NAD+ diphosphatase